MRDVVRRCLWTLFLLLAPSVSHAQGWSSCTANSGCIFQNVVLESGDGWNFDGTIPDDGRSWILRAFVTPGYTASIGGLNQVDHFDIYRDGMGGVYYNVTNAPYTYTGPTYVRGLSSAQWNVYDYYFTPGVRPFDNCATPGPADSKCGAFTNWWWNAAGVWISGPGGPVNLQLGLLAVPEPASWAMLIVGFGLIGGVARRRARVAAAA